MDLFLGGVEEPAVCVVPGDRIRKQIDDHLAECRARLIELERALAAGRPGADWLISAALVKQLIQTAELVRPAIGDGPFTMTCKQWIALCNRFSTMILGPDQIVEERARREAERKAGEQQQQNEGALKQ